MIGWRRRPRWLRGPLTAAERDEALRTFGSDDADAVLIAELEAAVREAEWRGDGH